MRSVIPCASSWPITLSRLRESAEHLAVAVAEHHALAVPEGVVVAVAVVHGRLERHAGAVDRVAGEHACEHLEGVAEPGVGLVDRHVAAGRLSLAPHEPAGQLVVALGVGDAPVGLRGRARRGGRALVARRVLGGHERRQLACGPPLAQGRVAHEGAACGLRCRVEPRVVDPGDARQQVGRHDRRVRRRMGVGPGHPRHAPIVTRPADSRAPTRRVGGPESKREPLAAGIRPCQAWEVSTAALAAPPEVRTHPIGLLPAVLVCGAAVLLFGFMVPVAGYALLVVGLVVAWLTDRSGRTSRLLPDLALIALGQAIISTISVAADISYGNMLLMGTVLGLAVVVPYVISRFVFGDRVIRFPWRTGRRWTRVQWGYLLLVLVLGWAILPFYFITSGVYTNWPTVTAPDEIARLFVGVNAVGTWDELFFICTVFALLRRHFPVWQANLLQTDRVRVVPLGARLPVVGAAPDHPVRAPAGLHVQAHEVAHVRAGRAPAVRRDRVLGHRVRAQRLAGDLPAGAVADRRGAR